MLVQCLYYKSLEFAVVAVKGKHVLQHSREGVPREVLVVGGEGGMSSRECEVVKGAR